MPGGCPKLKWIMIVVVSEVEWWVCASDSVNDRE